MRDSDMVIPESAGEGNLIAAAKQIMMASGSRKNLTDDEKEILGDLHTQLTTESTISEKEFDEMNMIEKELNVIQGRIMRGERYRLMIWGLGLGEAAEYLHDADEARKLTERLETLCRNDDREKKILKRAQNVLQMAMKRLEEEFKRRLVENRQTFEQKHASVFLRAFYSASKSCLGNYLLDLVQYDVIFELRRFAKLMFISGYGDECSLAYISIRRHALDECLFTLEKEKPRIEDVLDYRWDNYQSHLDSIKSKNKRWIQTMKIFVRVYLAYEKWLSEQLFGEIKTVNLVSFAEDLILQLLKYFGKAIPSNSLNPLKLFHILDMYKVLAGLHPNIDSLDSDKDISGVRVNRDEVLRGLADSVRPTLHEFQNYLITNVITSENFPVEGIHPLTIYVMTYISTLVDYMETLNFLLKDYDEEDPMLASPCLSSDVEEENISGGTCDFSPIAHSFRSNASILKWLYSGSPMSSAMQEEGISGGTSNFSPTSLQFGSDASLLKWLSDGFSISSATGEERITGSTCDISPVALHSRVVVSILEYKLYNEAKSFKDASLQHIFLINNIHYVAEKFKNSVLARFMLGEEWIGEHKKKLQQLVRNYEKITWSPIHSILNDEGSNSNFVSKALLRERLRSFYLAFEGVYRSQTTCFIPDAQLREDLRNSAPLKTIHAYKKFVQLHANHIGGKHIKYSVDDLQNCLLYLFEGPNRIAYCISSRGPKLG